MARKMIVSYVHHNKEVFVREDLKGKHRDHCLCFICDKFFPDDREKNCRIANIVYQVDITFDLVTPVWECPDFKFKFT